MPVSRMHRDCRRPIGDRAKTVAPADNRLYPNVVSIIRALRIVTRDAFAHGLRKGIRMIGAVARKLFGSANDRRIKGYQPRVDEINALEPGIAALSDDELRARTADFKKQIDGRQDARRYPGAGFRHRARGGQAHARPAPFRRAADRRHDPARRPHRRDEDRRRQDAGRDAAGLSQRARRPRRPRRHRQRLPRQARLRMDGTDLQLPRPDHRA